MFYLFYRPRPTTYDPVYASEASQWSHTIKKMHLKKNRYVKTLALGNIVSNNHLCFFRYILLIYMQCFVFRFVINTGYWASVLRTMKKEYKLLQTWIQNTAFKLVEYIKKYHKWLLDTIFPKANVLTHQFHLTTGGLTCMQISRVYLKKSIKFNNRKEINGLRLP